MNNQLSTPVKLTYGYLLLWTVDMVVWLLPHFSSLLFATFFLLTGILLLLFPLFVILVIYSVFQSKDCKFRFIPLIWIVCLVGVSCLKPLCIFPTPLDSMAANYETHHRDLQELKKYASIVLDDKCALRLEIHRNKIDMFACADSTQNVFEWHDKEYHQYMPSIGLTMNELDSLVLLLKKANCIGLNINGHYVEDIWYSRPSFLDLYSYGLLDEPMDEQQWASFDKYSSIPYCDTVVFWYGAPAFGTDVIPDEQRARFHQKYHPLLQSATP